MLTPREKRLSARTVMPDLRAPGNRTADLSLFKNTYFGPEGRWNLQFRTEAFNAFNTPKCGANGGAFATVDGVTKDFYEAGVLGGELIEDFGGTIVGGVVDDDDFAAEVLRKRSFDDALKDGGSELLFVVEGDEDGEEITYAGVPSRSRCRGHRRGCGLRLWGCRCGL